VHKFLMITGGFITACSAFFVAAAVGELFTGPSDTRPEILWGLFIFFSIAGLSGLYLCMNNFFKDRRKKREQKERLVLKFITEKKGRVTPVEIAAETTLLIDEVKKILDTLCDNGMGQLTVTENGGIVYEFEEFVSPEEKAGAKSPLDI